MLSKYTHFEFDHHTHFFLQDSKNTYTVRFGPTLRAYSVHILFLAMTFLAKYILLVSPLQIQKEMKSVGELSQLNEKIDDYSDLVCNMLKNDPFLAELDILIHSIVHDKTI